MKLQDLVGKTCLIGLTYYDTAGNVLKRTQQAGKVVSTDEQKGISIRLSEIHRADTPHIASDKEERIFVLPPLLTPWFTAPRGHYRDEGRNLLIEDPDYLVTWGVHKTQDEKQGDHEWWEWVPQTTPPAIN